MNPKAASVAMVLSIFLISVVAGMQVVEADPVLVSKFPVAVTIILPKDNATFVNGTFSINFSLGDVAYDKIILHSSIPFTVSVKWMIITLQEKKCIFLFQGLLLKNFLLM